MIILGTIVNTFTVIIGSMIGLYFNNKIPERFNTTLFDAIGAFTIFLGIKMAFESKNILVIVFSLILGGLLGDYLDINSLIEKISNRLKIKIIKISKSKNEKFTKTFSEGMIGAFLLFCMGAMTIIGSFEEGINLNHKILLTKALMDGFASIAFASSLGIGVLFSAIPLFLFQTGLTLLAKFFGSFIPQTGISNLTATGGIILIMLGLNL